MVLETSVITVKGNNPENIFNKFSYESESSGSEFDHKS